MKNLTTIIIAAVIGIVAAYVTVQSSLPEDFKPTEKEESAFERVIRTGVFRCGYTIWPPYYDVDPNTGEVVGAMREFTEATLGLIGLKVEYTAQYSYGSEAADFEADKFDGICNDGPWNVNGSKFRDFTDPWGYAQAFLAYDKKYKGNNKDSFDHVETGFIGIDGDWSEELPRAIFPNAKINTLPNTSLPSELLYNVDTGKADAAIIDRGFYDTYVESNPDTNVVIEDYPVAIYPFGISVKKGEQELLNMLNLAIEIANNLGLYKNILDEKDIDPRAVSLPIKRYELDY